MPDKARRNRVAVRCSAAAGIALCAVTVAVSANAASASSRGHALKSPRTSSSQMAALRADLATNSKLVTSYPTVAPIKGGVASLKGKTVWWIPIGSSIPTLAALGTAMQTSLAHVGVKLDTCDGKLVPTTIANCLSEAVTQHASAVVTGFVDYASMPTSFNTVVAHHIPVLVGGELPDGGKTKSTAKLGFYPTRLSDDTLQRLEMESIITGSKGKANILYIGVTDSPETKHENAYAESFAKSHCSGCTWTQITYNTAAISKLPSAVSAALLSNPNTTDVACETDLCEPDALEGIQTANDANKVKVFSANGNLSSLQDIAAGKLTADMGISSDYFGWQWADGVLRMLKGDPPVVLNTTVRVFDKGDVSGLKLTPAAYATQAWYGSNSFEKGFENAWVGK